MRKDNCYEYLQHTNSVRSQHEYKGLKHRIEGVLRMLVETNHDLMDLYSDKESQRTYFFYRCDTPRGAFQISYFGIWDSQYSRTTWMKTTERKVPK